MNKKVIVAIIAAVVAILAVYGVAIDPEVIEQLINSLTGE